MTHKKRAPRPPLVFDDLDDLEAFMSAVENNPDNPEPALELLRGRALAMLRASGVDFAVDLARHRALAKLRARGVPPDAPSLLDILSAIRSDRRDRRPGEFFPTLRLGVPELGGGRFRHWVLSCRPDDIR